MALLGFFPTIVGMPRLEFEPTSAELHRPGTFKGTLYRVSYCAAAGLKLESEGCHVSYRWPFLHHLGQLYFYNCDLVSAVYKSPNHRWKPQRITASWWGRVLYTGLKVKFLTSLDFSQITATESWRCISPIYKQAASKTNNFLSMSPTKLIFEEIFWNNPLEICPKPFFVV